MSWCISIVINEVSREEAIKLLDCAVNHIKTENNIFFDSKITDDDGLPRLEYDSYKGI